MSRTDVTKSEVARGAGLAGLSRAGALIEALAQPLYIWMFGLPTYGLYVVLWGAVSLATNLLDLSMTSALQRVVPARADPVHAHGAVKLALLITVGPAIIVAAIAALNADALAGLFSAAPDDAALLPLAIIIFAWALPLWTLVEVATSAARARRAFGPEIRLRIFWEQLARLAFAILFFAIGMDSLGLVSAHLASLLLTAGLCLPLVRRYYDLGLMARAPLTRPMARELVTTGLSLLPANLSRRMLIDAPPLVINFLIPGTRGASAAGIFEIARKLSTVPHIVRQSFNYVLAPLSSAQAHADRSVIAPLYRFSARISTALVIPLAGLMVFTGRDVLSVYRDEAIYALPLLAILCAARAIEAMVGPATTIVEMTGHRALPLLNSVIALIVWAVLAWWLTPLHGAFGMAIAVAAAIVAASWAASVELRQAEGLSPFDSRQIKGALVALAGVSAMALVAWLAGGPVRFFVNLAIWAGTSWLALRHGLDREDRAALGGLARRLRLG